MKAIPVWNQLNYGSTIIYVLDANTIQLVHSSWCGEVYASNKQYGQLVPQECAFSKFGLEGQK
jgi:hypothetical protein